VLTLEVCRPAAQNDNLQVHEEKSRGVYVKGLTQYNVSEAAEVYQIMRQGQASRATSSTSESLAAPRDQTVPRLTPRAARHERREFALALDLCHQHQPAQCRHWRGQGRSPLPGRSGRLREGSSAISSDDHNTRLTPSYLPSLSDRENRRDGSDTRGGQEDQQESLGTRHRHQRPDRRQGPSGPSLLLVKGCPTDLRHPPLPGSRFISPTATQS
jgi:hypothetical protein